MKNYFFIFITILFSCTKEFQLKEGDLLFQDLDSSPVCDAIELVTPGYKGANFSHIGIVVASGDAFCKNVGGRLCTKEEVENNCVSDSGC